MPQLQYTIGMAAGFAGMIADSAIVQDIETFYNPAGALFFGRVASRGAADGLIIHPATAAGVTDEKLVRGLIVATHEGVTKYPSDGLDPSYAPAMPIPVMRKGRMWVVSEDVVVEGTSSVYARHAANGGNTKLGSLRASADTGAALLPKSKWKTSTTAAGQLAIVEIDL